MLQKIDKKKYIFFYLIIFIILSSIHNSNFRYNNFFSVKKIDVIGLNKSNSLLLEKKLVNFIGYNRNIMVGATGIEPVTPAVSRHDVLREFPI